MQEHQEKVKLSKGDKSYMCKNKKEKRKQFPVYLGNEHQIQVTYVFVNLTE